jgi:transposase
LLSVSEYGSLLARLDALFVTRLSPLIRRTKRALKAEADGEGYEPVEIEREIEALGEEVAAQVVQHLVKAVDGGRVRNEHICPTCGGRLRFVQQSRRRLGFLFGRVALRRARYHCTTCRKGRAPLEYVWGLQGGECPMGKRGATPRVQAELARMCAAADYAQAQGHFTRLTRLQVSRMTGWRYAQRLGKQQREREAAGEGDAPFRSGRDTG